MNIIEVSSFIYPSDLRDVWCNEAFVPIADYKFRIQLADESIIEAGVFDIFLKGKTVKHLCLSTQAGCKFRCEMCSSGKNGFVRNLEIDEIFMQLKMISEYFTGYIFDHVVFMGIGEPLDNYNNFVGSVKRIINFNEEYSGNLSFATVCVPKKLVKLSYEKIPSFKMLWISLHSAISSKRLKIMPVAGSFSIKEILQSAKTFSQNTSTKVYINHILFKEFNDGEKDAQILAHILQGTEDIFTLMLTQPNNDISSYERADISCLYEFEERLRRWNFRNKVTRFIAAGQPVNAGCGEFIFSGG